MTTHSYSDGKKVCFEHGITDCSPLLNGCSRLISPMDRLSDGRPVCKSQDCTRPGRHSHSPDSDVGANFLGLPEQPCNKVAGHPRHGWGDDPGKGVEWFCPGVDRRAPTKTRQGDQPLPTSNDGEFVQDRIIAAMEESKRVGDERYGTPLQTFNGRDTLKDAAEEARDLYVYLTSLQMAREAERERLVEVVAKAVGGHYNDRSPKDWVEVEIGDVARVAVDAILNATGGAGC